nr:MAG TPA: hypothetical protein [Bacteriophage sp.]DAY68786.1 MAG TPA: hypothetical protein [Caudoviricetes sp.]
MYLSKTVIGTHRISTVEFQTIELLRLQQLSMLHLFDIILQN